MPVLLILVAQLISIHALREEGDNLLRGLVGPLGDFYPRPPRGGRLLFHRNKEMFPCNFYPRPPRGGRRQAEIARRIEMGISIHALREEGDAKLQKSKTDKKIFLSTPSARRATCQPFCVM